MWAIDFNRIWMKKMKNEVNFRRKFRNSGNGPHLRGKIDDFYETGLWWYYYWNTKPLLTPDKWTNLSKTNAHFAYCFVYCSTFFDIFCIFCMLQYAKYAEYEPCTLLLHILLHIVHIVLHTAAHSLPYSAYFACCIMQNMQNMNPALFIAYCIAYCAYCFAYCSIFFAIFCIFCTLVVPTWCQHPINNSQAEEAGEELAGLVSELMGDDEVGEAQGPNPAKYAFVLERFVRLSGVSRGFNEVWTES